MKKINKLPILSFFVPFFLIGCGQSDSSQTNLNEGFSKSKLNANYDDDDDNDDVANNLCLADQSSVVALGKTYVHISGKALIDGNLILSNELSSLKASGFSMISSDVLHVPNVKTKFSGLAGYKGQMIEGNYGSLIAESLLLSNELAQYQPTQILEEIDDDLTLVGNGMLNVIQVNRNIHLSGKERLILSGSNKDVFVINIFGDFHLSGVSSIQLDGVAVKNVIFHFPRSNSEVHLSGQSSLSGSILNPNGNVHLSGGGRVVGTVKSGGDLIHISGQGLVLEPAPFCPEPSDDEDDEVIVPDDGPVEGDDDVVVVPDDGPVAGDDDDVVVPDDGPVAGDDDDVVVPDDGPVAGDDDVVVPDDGPVLGDDDDSVPNYGPVLGDDDDALNY